MINFFMLKEIMLILILIAFLIEFDQESFI